MLLDNSIKMTLEEIVRRYMNEGDFLYPEMDTVLESIKDENEGVEYTYYNDYSNCGGFLAIVTITKDNEKMKVWIIGDGNGHFVQNMETK